MSNLGTLQSDQLHSVLRYDTSMLDPALATETGDEGGGGGGSGGSIETPWRQQFVFEESTTMPLNADRNSNVYTPLSSVRFDFVNNESRSGLPMASSPRSKVIAAGNIQPPMPGTSDAAAQAKKNSKVRNALIIAAVVLLLLVGIAIIVWLTQKHSSSGGSNAAAAAAATAQQAAAGGAAGGASASSVLSDADTHSMLSNEAAAATREFSTLMDGYAVDENAEQQQVFGIAVPDFTAPNKEAAAGTDDAQNDLPASSSIDNRRPSAAGMRVAEPRNVADDHKRHQPDHKRHQPDHKRHQPPASSWFGAPRREDQKRDIDSAVLNAEGDIAKIYDKGRGGGNSVLGGPNCAPYATVNAEAARFVGWGEQKAYDPAQDSSLDPNNGTRSMLSLYQDKMKTAKSGGSESGGGGGGGGGGDTAGPSTMYRDGSSLSTVTSADQAARVADPHFESKEAQFEQGRARAKQIASEASAAISGIYERKHRAAAGNIVAEAAQNNDDPNFSYFNTSTQAMLGNE